MATGREARTMMVFAVGERRFALPGAQVVEIARIDGVTAIPSDDPANLGLVLHRARVIPLVDVAQRLGLSGGPRGPRQPLTLVVRAGFGDVGFPIDAVVGFGSTSSLPASEGVTFVDLEELWKRHAANPSH